MFIAARVKIELLEFSQLCNNNWKLDFFSGELASGYACLNKAPLFAFFRGFILTSNLGESFFDNGGFLLASVLTSESKKRDKLYCL